MIPSRWIPNAIWILLGITVILATARTAVHQFAILPAHSEPWFGACLLVLSAIASVATLIMSRYIAREYEPQTRMRTAWILIAASAGAALLRYVHELVFRFGPVAWRGLLHWRHFFVVISLCLLIAGLIAMFRSFVSMGLGFSASRSDYALLLLILLITPAVVWFREGLPDARAANLLVRYLQFASPVLVAAPAAVSVLLYRVSRQMDGGQIASSLRYLMFFTMMRLLLFLRVIPPIGTTPDARSTHSILSETVPWIFALAVAYRWQLAAEAQERLLVTTSDTPDHEEMPHSIAARLNR